MADQGFGKFKPVGEFPERRRAAEERKHAQAQKGLAFEERVRRRHEPTSSIVEVAAKLREPEDNGKNLNVSPLATMAEVRGTDTAVKDGDQRVLESGDDVFVAVGDGDGMGSTRPIVGLKDSVGPALKRERIPKANAFANGGAALSVLHFTHHPLGFICVDKPAACYS